MFAFRNIVRATAVVATSFASMYMYDRKKRGLALAEEANLSQRQTIPRFRPNDWTHMHYAVEVYKDNGGKILTDGWQLIKTCKEKNGYFGAAYINSKQKHIIIAHRGTQDLADWQSNFDLISRGLNEQEASAWNVFAKSIVEEYGAEYSYSFTGHSLGGWLAQTALWKYQDEFVKEQYPLYKDGFAVILDEPGAKEVLEALQPRVESSYRIATDSLDITSYLSHPNIVNTALSHIGSIYALFPKLKDFSWLEYHTIAYTLEAHAKDLLLKEFDQQSGLAKKCVRVIDWPKIALGENVSSSSPTKSMLGYLAFAVKLYIKGEVERGEYTGFFNYKPNDVDSFVSLPPASQFQLQHGIHYRVKAFNAQILPLRNMPMLVRKFLQDLNQYKDKVATINDLTSDKKFASLMNFYINAREEIVLRDVSATTFRAELLVFLNKYPKLLENNLASLKSEQMLSKSAEDLVKDLQEQTQINLDLINKLIFQYGTARLYKFIKPTWEEIAQVQQERHDLIKHISLLQALKIKLELSNINSPTLSKLLLTQEQELTLAKQSNEILLNYMQGNLKQADKQLDNFMLQIANLDINLDLNLLLNRAYNLKAKIAACEAKSHQAISFYKQATKLLPNDSLTWSNYAGFLTDLGRAQQDVNLYLQAYNCLQKVYLNQLKTEQLPIVASGMAYNYIMLAQCQDRQKNISVPDSPELRKKAKVLLEKAVSNNPTYLNARLFLAILHYDQANYNLALQEVDNALSLQANHITALMRKGLILAKLNNTEEALAYLNQAKNLAQLKSSNLSWLQEIDRHIENIQVQQTKLRM